MSPYPRPPKPPHNLCRSGGEDFNALKLFEAHRVGTHEYTYSEVAAMDPPREHGRRCLTVDEMHELGWTQDAKGYWFDPVKAKRTSDYFQKRRSDGTSPAETPREPEAGE